MISSRRRASSSLQAGLPLVVLLGFTGARKSHEPENLIRILSNILVV